MEKNLANRKKAASWLLAGLILVSASCQRTSPLPAASTSGGSSQPTEPDYPPRDNRQAKVVLLDEGMHKVGSGEEIPPGRYRITGTGTGNVNIYKYSVLYISEILGWEVFGVDSLTVDLDESNTVQVADLKSARLEPVATALKTELSAGEWVVGLDLEPGTYELAAGSEESGQILLYNTAGWVTVSRLLGGVLVPDTIELELADGEVFIVSNLNQVSLRALHPPETERK